MKSPEKIFTDDFESGRLAYIAGVSIDDCPYGHDGKTKPEYRNGQRKSWMAGWLEAEYFAKYRRRKGEISE